MYSPDSNTLIASQSCHHRSQCLYLLTPPLYRYFYNWLRWETALIILWHTCTFGQKKCRVLTAGLVRNKCHFFTFIIWLGLGTSVYSLFNVCTEKFLNQNFVHVSKSHTDIQLVGLLQTLIRKLHHNNNIPARGGNLFSLYIDDRK